MTTCNSKLDKLAWLLMTTPQNATLEEVGLSEHELGQEFFLLEGRAGFNDRAIVVQRAIRYIQDAVILTQLDAPQRLFTELQRIAAQARQARSDNLVGQALSQLGNSGKLDVLDLALQASEGADSMLAVPRVMEVVLPLLEGLQPAKLLKLIERCEQSGLLVSGATHRMRREPILIAPIIEACTQHPTLKSGPLLRNALIEATAADRSSGIAQIHSLIANTQPALSLQALEALGRVNWATAEQSQTEAALAVIRSGFRSDSEDVRRTAIGAGLDLVETDPARHGLIDEILALDDPELPGRIGDYLGFYAHQLNQEPWYQSKVDLLAGRVGVASDGLSGIDHILAQLFDGDRCRCMAWIDTWVAANGGKELSLANAFPSLFEKMVEEREELGLLLAQWFIHDDYRMQRAANDALDELSLHRITRMVYPARVLDNMADAELQLLVLRTVVHVLSDEQRVSLVWSLTKADSAQERTYPLVLDAMVNSIGYDYPQAVRSHLMDVSAGDAVQPEVTLAQEILVAMDTYEKPLQALPPIEELLPSSEEQNLFFKGRATQMQKSMDRASENSMMAKIATMIPIKAGRSMFQVIEGHVGKSTPMISSSHSAAIPRSEIIDKVGSDIERRHTFAMRLVMR
ncbi:hypothetical protein [Stenotrophomonas maltophilia]